eukprot:5651286-Heterocapsa_arctica.AAC.1
MGLERDRYGSMVSPSGVPRRRRPRLVAAASRPGRGGSGRLSSSGQRAARPARERVEHPEARPAARQPARRVWDCLPRS